MLAYYKNGNYLVKLYRDGTKIKQTKDDFFRADFPDSIDLKITNYCDLNCPMCHEKSTKRGKHADLDKPFLNTLQRGTELAIGGGNPLSHPQILPFLQRLKKQGIICNLTVNERHFLQNISLLQDLINQKLIYGLGISLNLIDNKTLEFATKNKNVVFHVINGLFKGYDKLANQGFKILILGYKTFGRGKEYYNEQIAEQLLLDKQNIKNLFNKFKVVSFDNLALEQLDIKSLVDSDTWDSYFMGADGEASMYIDLVKEQFALSSTTKTRYALKDDIVKMFNVVKPY